jgi:predicted component of type VI protein secretion system
MQAWLETTGVAGQRLRFALSRPELRIGSIGTSDVWIPLPGVNRTHCRIESEPGGWRVKPVRGATVRVNDIDHGTAVPIAAGDRLRVGPVEFAVRTAVIDVDVSSAAIATSPTTSPTTTA